MSGSDVVCERCMSREHYKGMCLICGKEVVAK